MLRIAVLTFGIFLGIEAQATGFDFVPANGGPEKEFRSALDAGNFRDALVAWTPAHSGSAFGQSQTGKALYAYLLHQNGMPFTAAGLLVRQIQPDRIAPGLLSIWTTELRSSRFVQKGWIPTTGRWNLVVNNSPATFSIKSKRDIQAAFARADRLPVEQVNARARVWWRVATFAPLIGEEDLALKALKLLKESGQTFIGQDMVVSAYARVLYQKGDMDGALGFFAQVPKSSSIWVESVEERAWAHLRREDHDRAMGEVVTLMSPALAPLVGPESYFLSNLMSLKVCDYPRLFKTSELFKKRHRERLVDLQELAKTGTSKNTNAVLEKFERNGVSIEAAGPLVSAVPRSAIRDGAFIRQVESRRQLLLEAEKAGELARATDALGGSAEFERWASEARAHADRLRPQAAQRLKILARGEVDEYRRILNKMHIVEAQVIERLHLDDNLKGRRNQLSKTDDQGDVLIFPYKSDEVWFDELDNYKARVKDCPTLHLTKGASL